MTLRLGLFGSGFQGRTQTPCEPFQSLFRALNSAVECHLHTVEVVGSNPTAPTILRPQDEGCRAGSARRSFSAGGSIRGSGIVIPPHKCLHTWFLYQGTTGPPTQRMGRVPHQAHKQPGFSP